jgi:hypothetical protein
VRKALNDNPIAQIAVLGVLAVVVAFLVMTRVMSSSSSSPATTTPTTSATPSSGTGTPTTGATAPPTTGSTAVPTDGSAPTTAPTSTPTVPGSTSTAAAPVSGKLGAGPGLPKPVAKAYAQDKAIVLLVYRRNGIDDAAVRASVARLRTGPDVAVFVTEAGRVARYSRITAGLDVNRVPALIVIRPKSLSHGAPTGSVSYGFRGPASVDQAVRDALYKGPSDLPYYPK